MPNVTLERFRVTSTSPTPCIMKPSHKLAESTTPDGARLTLYEHDRSYCIRLNGQQLMHSSVTASELLLGELAMGNISRQAAPSILIGGLGLGFTLKSVLKMAGPKAKVQIAELIPEIVDWNRKFLYEVNGALLEDPRVEVFAGDVWDLITRAGRGRFDALLLDIDNGPAAMVQKQNARLYNRHGLRQIAAALKPGGRAAIWSASPDRGFVHRLGEAGFKVQVVPAKLHPTSKQHACTIYVADK
jgi:spermidine synthase